MAKNEVTILVVEDNVTLLELVAERLGQEGWRVETATDGESGLAKAVKIKPSLILLDLLLPKKDGITVLKELRTKVETKGIPVIVLTNLSDGETVANVLSSGGMDFLIKTDYSLDQVVERIKKRLPKKKNGV